VKLKFFFWIAGLFLFSYVLFEILFLKDFPIEHHLLKGSIGLSQRAKAEGKCFEPRPVPMEIPAEAIGHVDLYILAGQSNMSGYGEIHPEELEVDPKIFVFGNDYHWRLAREPIDDPTGQVDLVSIDFGVGFSCGTTFAKTLLRYDPKAFIGLIPCAKSDSSIEEWQRNLSDYSLYGSCLKRSLASSPMGRIKGLLFYQGETDTLNPNLGPQKVKNPFQWGEKFSKFVKDIRNDLKIHDLPIVFAQIGTNKNTNEFKNWKIVQEQQRQVHLPNCKMIHTDDLSLKDEVHFDSKSYRVIGERFGLAMIEIFSMEHQK